MVSMSHVNKFILISWTEIMGISETHLTSFFWGAGEGRREWRDKLLVRLNNNYSKYLWVPYSVPGALLSTACVLTVTVPPAPL